MSSRIFLLLLCLLPLAGCDKIKAMMGVPAVADPKELDAQAIGYACRVSKKQPEPCMKENDTQSPSQILSGWKRGYFGRGQVIRIHAEEVEPGKQMLVYSGGSDPRGDGCAIGW